MNIVDDPHAALAADMRRLSDDELLKYAQKYLIELTQVVEGMSEEAKTPAVLAIATSAEVQDRWHRLIHAPHFVPVGPKH